MGKNPEAGRGLQVGQPKGAGDYFVRRSVRPVEQDDPGVEAIF